MVLGSGCSLGVDEVKDMEPFDGCSPELELGPDSFSGVGTGLRLVHLVSRPARSSLPSRAD
eukprot:15440162-Alexandrium_andersonii.AAC.1